MRGWIERWDGAELWAAGLLAGFLCAASSLPLVISIVVSPEAIESGRVMLSPPCPVRTQTGEECATCGLTRGFSAMSRLRIADALAYNRGAPWLYAACWLCAIATGSIVGRVSLEALSRRRTAPPLVT